MPMGAWDTYEARLEQMGCPKREFRVKSTQNAIHRLMMDSPSCHLVTINGVEQYITVAHTDDMSQKRICAVPGESLEHGGLVEFANNHWLVTELDADDEVYAKGLMQQCNYQLRWMSKDGKLKEKWCYVVDGTKYLIGEKSEETMTIGDARIAVTVAKDEDTIELERGLRFLIDDTDSANPLVYRITKPNKLYNNFNGKGVFRFILNECVLEDGDNVEERIANMTDWLPERELVSDHKDTDCTVAEIVETAKEETSTAPTDDKKVWL